MIGQSTVAAGIAVGLALALAAPAPANADNYPSHPITMIVPLAPGGSTDVLGRIMAQSMSKRLGQPIVVENVAGAAGTIGVTRAERSAPDGYTVLWGMWGTNVANGAIYKLPFDLLNDFQPIALVATQPFLIDARKTMPANNLKELIAWLKANGDKTTMGTSGVGSPSHVAGVLMENMLGLHWQMVAYRSAGLATNDLLAGITDIQPDEAGMPGYYFYFWHAMWAPKGTPKDIVAKLNAAAVDSLADPATRKRLTDLAQEIYSRDQQTPEALYAFQKSEVEKWWPIIKAAGIKAE